MSENLMLCYVCKHDHTNKDRPWCDLSDLEIAFHNLSIKNKELERKLEVAINALEFYANRNGEYDWPTEAREALKEIEK